MSSDAALTVLAAAAPATTVWPSALKSAGGFDALLGLPRAGLARLGLSAESSRALARPDTTRITAMQRWLDGADRRLVTLGSPDYPPLLDALRDTPIALWIEGRRPDLLADPQLAIVGSRRPSAGGIGLARELAATLGTAGITITSGLATGIDAAAHAGAIDTTGGTLAVLGSGIDRIYPARNRALAREIVARGLVVSEYAPGIAPHPHQFPARNRIIAGLSLGTLVVEAAARSGSLITARLAGDYGRDVFAVPGSVRSALSRGCHRLLRSGACLVESAEDVLAELAPAVAHLLAEPALDGADSKTAQCDRRAATDGDDAATLLNHLDFSPATISELAAVAGLTAKDVSSMLLHLELEGTVEALPGGRYCRLNKRSR